MSIKSGDKKMYLQLRGFPVALHAQVVRAAALATLREGRSVSMNEVLLRYVAEGVANDNKREQEGK